MAVSPTATLDERELLEAARGGDEDAFRRIVEEHRTLLHAHCYRMLGSLQDAEDALQETFLRAWRGLSDFGGRSSLRTWLYRIATNVCLDASSRRRTRILPPEYGPAFATPTAVGAPLVESTTWVEPYPDEPLGIEDGPAAPGARYEQREAVELAFIAALQHLPPNQRAVLILRDVLGFSAREAAERLDTSVASVNSALQRARKTVEARLPERSQQATLRALGDDRIRGLVDAYVDAWARRDVEAIAALLAEDAVFSMPPWAAWWQGRKTIAAFASAAHDECPESRMVPTRANGQPALAGYLLDSETGVFRAASIEVLRLEDGRVKEITAFATPELFPRFGLPSELAP
jgi:RNA polymerase sigma-70 factor (ECF subfamily)